MVPTKSLAASIAAWVIGAVAAVTVGMIALSLIGTGWADRPVQPLSPGIPLLGATEAGPRVTAGVAAQPSEPGPKQGTVSSVGGTVIARCSEAGAYLVGWSPAPGYHADDVTRGPTLVARLKFEGNGREVKIYVRCGRDGSIQPQVRDERHYH